MCRPLPGAVIQPRESVSMESKHMLLMPVSITRLEFLKHGSIESPSSLIFGHTIYTLKSLFAEQTRQTCSKCPIVPKSTLRAGPRPGAGCLTGSRSLAT